jgi:transposase
MNPQSEDTGATAPSNAVEETLIRETEWGAIRELRARGMSKKAIARELSLDIKTVRKWLITEHRRQRRPGRGRVLEAHEEFLRARSPEVGFNGAVLKRELEARGVKVHYATLANYIAPWRKEWRGESEPVVRFETGPGEQAQVDWGEVLVWLSERKVKVHVFTMVLGYSRRIYARGYLSEGLGSLLDAHEKAFAHFGGRTARILYDNPRTIVTRKDEMSGEIAWNRTFKDRMDFYGVGVKLCRYYRAQTKGKVESGVKYVKRNALVGQRFRDLADLNTYLLGWCHEVADQRIHGTTHEKPAERFERAEKQVLIAVDLRTPPPRERVERRIVARDAFVAAETNRYPVPYGWAGEAVTVRILFEEILVHHPKGQTVRHARLKGAHQVACWEGPPRPLPWRQKGSRVPAADLEETGGQVEIRPLSEYEALVEVLS